MEKAPILLLHGALGTAQSFKQLIPILTERFDVYTFDFIGHGINTSSDKVLNINNLTNQISEFIESSQLKSVHIFGYSMGGFAAINLVHLQPEKVRSLITFATKWDWNEASALKESSMLDVEKIQEKVPKFANYLASLHGEHQWKSTVEKVKNMMMELGKNNPFDSAFFNNIETSILLGVGDKDTTVSLEETIEVYRQLPKSNLFVMPKTPHPFEKVNVKLIANLIIDFCDSV